jgi:hypothetical protein
MAGLSYNREQRSRGTGARDMQDDFCALNAFIYETAELEQRLIDQERDRGRVWVLADDADEGPGNCDDQSLHVSLFDLGIPKEKGTALGQPHATTWRHFSERFLHRREGNKNGPNVIPARFEMEPDGRVSRLKERLISRTGVALDVEASKTTREMPPQLDEAVARVRAEGWAAVAYTSHNHAKAAPRYRIVMPLSEEIDPDLPAPEVVARRLGLDGVLDRSKLNAASLFYLPSCEPGQAGDHHKVEIVSGAALDAVWVSAAAWTLMAQRRIEEERIAAAARAEAEEKRKARVAAGSDPDASLIDQIRQRLDLRQILLDHGYNQRGSGTAAKFMHPNSQSKVFGADIAVFGGIERLFSHNGTDPLHAANLPDWCGGVTALDAFDVTVILDYGGNREKAMTELAERFGLSKRKERKELSALLFKLIEAGVPQDTFEQEALAKGAQLGLTMQGVIETARWVAAKMQGAI